MFTETILNVDIESFGTIAKKYENLKIQLNEMEEQIDIIPMLKDEENEEAIYIELSKIQALTLSAILNTYANQIK